MHELVSLNRNEKPVTTSLLIAEKFEKRHDHVLRDIRSLITDCGDEGISLPRIEERDYKKRGKSHQYFVIDRDTFVLLAMGFTGKKALRFKSDYIKQFNRIEQHLLQIALQRQTSSWNKDRLEGQLQRRRLTDAIAPFKIYALNQGCKGTSVNAYKNFSKLVNKAAGVKSGERELLTDDMLRRMAHLEGIIEIKVKGLMEGRVYCKDIYLQCKELMENFVALVPYTGEKYLPKTEQGLLEEAA